MEEDEVVVGDGDGGGGSKWKSGGGWAFGSSIVIPPSWNVLGNESNHQMCTLPSGLEHRRLVASLHCLAHPL